jgi:serine phosphatase RsbU (regulator of sigma subunit)
VVPGAVSTPTVESPRVDAARLPSTSVRVLLVEDDEGDAFLVRELLLDAGSEVELTRARTLAEAVLALPRDVDCVLLDLGLPDADGLSALRSVLDVAPSIAVLVLTGLADEHRGTEAVAAGAQDYLVKGAIDGQLLTRAIRYAVERKRADESVRRLYASEVRAAENSRLERGLLPQPLVSENGVRVDRLYRPGRHQSLLGGDFYDVVERPDGTVFALIGDVAGHGPDEAALGVCLRIAWRTLVLAGADPETVLGSMHDVLVSERDSDEVFATVAMLRADPRRGTARFWLAGHPVPLVIDGTDVRPGPTEASGLALGIVDGVVWVGVDAPVAPGSTVVLFTDGLIEGYDGRAPGRRLGDEGMRQVLGRLVLDGMSGKELADALLAEVQERNGGDLTDDVALLLLRW